MHHSIAPKPAAHAAFRILIGGPDCSQPYSASVFNISAMSFGSLSANAILALNMGAKLGGYCSDGTRTFAVGEPGEAAREVYETVREAQAQALEAVAAGVKAEALDMVAREAIAAAGHGDRFGHGLGHGVGLEVHEEPRVSQRSEDVLAAAEVVTIEPGIYLPGELGVRIEDLVVVEEDGCRNLSGLPKGLQLVD